MTHQAGPSLQGAGRMASPGWFIMAMAAACILCSPAATLADEGQGRGRGGQSEASGRSGEVPGKSGEAPGRSGEAPGRSGEAPGRSDQAAGRSGDAHGHAGEAPGRGRDTAGEGTGQGSRTQSRGQQDAAPETGARATAAPGRAGGERGGRGNGASPEAPLILAPHDPGRLTPSSSNLVESGGVEGYSALDEPPPVTATLPSTTLPVVVELFTSQGCSSCPPADAMLAMLSGQQDVLPLSYHVDYWDYLGWADSFARPEFTERQTFYAHAVGERSVYTPQIIVDGQDTAVAPGPAQLMALIDSRRYAPAMINVQRQQTDTGETIELLPLSELGGSIDIVLVRYAPEREVEMQAGENRGRTVLYTNIVLSLEQLSRWDGKAPLRLHVRNEQVDDARYPQDTQHAILVQQMQGRQHLPGPILAAIHLN